jgi:hypothetical protein
MNTKMSETLAAVLHQLEFGEASDAIDSGIVRDGQVRDLQWCREQVRAVWYDLQNREREAGTLIVYVVFHETNTGHGEESDGYVEGVYASESIAEAVRLRAIRAARDAGLAVWWDPDNPDARENDEWDHDWRVEPHALLETDTGEPFPWAE